MIGLASQIWLWYVPQGLCLAIKEMFRIEGFLEKRIVTKNSHFYILNSLNLIEETGFFYYPSADGFTKDSKLMTRPMQTND